MKKSIVFYVLTLFVSLTVLFTSCKKTSQNDGKITFDSIVVREHVPLLGVEVNDSTLPYADMNIKFTYPVEFKNEEKVKRLQEIFVGTFYGNTELDTFSPKEAIDLYVDEYKREYKSLASAYYEEKEQLPEGNTPMWYWYYINLENSVVFHNESLLSYVTEYSDYTGGAHGSYNVRYTNVYLDELVTISEEDIFIPNYQQTLAEKIVNRLMIQNDVSSREGLIEIGYFNVDEIFPNNNFWLDDEGIHYAFNQYEIAPYVMGVIEVFVPYEDIQDILKPEDGIDKLLPDKE